MDLTRVEVRVLGALMEKEMTTPENYPLSLNSLLAACNQRSSREPVMELAEDEVRQALHGLEARGWTAPVREGRVARYEHRVRTVLQLRRDETAVLCVLLLRGPQTVGELRGRADRMYSFDDLQAVTATLERMAGPERMAERPVAARPVAGSSGAGSSGTASLGAGAGSSGPLVVLLARHAGSREARYMHLLGGPVEAAYAKAGESWATGQAPTAAGGELRAARGELWAAGREPRGTGGASATGQEARATGATGEDDAAGVRAEMEGLRERCAQLEERVSALEVQLMGDSAKSVHEPHTSVANRNAPVE